MTSKPRAVLYQDSPGRVALRFESHTDFMTAVEENRNNNHLPIFSEGGHLLKPDIVFADSVDKATVIRHFGQSFDIYG